MATRSSILTDMKKLEAQNFEGYKMLVSKPADADEIWDFYSRPGRSEDVVLRDEKVVRAAAEGGDFVIIRNKLNNIIAASATYLLAGGNPISAIFNNENKPESPRRTRELGSVLKRDEMDKPNENGIFLRWITIVPLFGGSEFNALVNADKEKKAFDRLVCNVNRTNQTTMLRILGDASVKDQTPLQWMWTRPTQELIDADLAISNDPNVAKESNFFWDSVHHLGPVAQYFRNAARELTQGKDDQWDKCVFKNHYGDRFMLDMSELPEPVLAAIELLAEYPRLPETIGKLNMSWAEACGQFTPLMSKPPSDPNGLIQAAKQLASVANGNGNGRHPPMWASRSLTGEVPHVA